MATTKIAAKRSMAAVKAAAKAGKARLVVFVLTHKGETLPGFSADEVKAKRRAAYYRFKRGMNVEVVESRITMGSKLIASMSELLA